MTKLKQAMSGVDIGEFYAWMKMNQARLQGNNVSVIRKMAKKELGMECISRHYTDIYVEKFKINTGKPPRVNNATLMKKCTVLANSVAHLYEQLGVTMPDQLVKIVNGDG